MITRKSSQRLKGYDYSKPNWYYVTVCTKQKQDWLGEIDKDQMILNECGDIVKQQWLWLSKNYDYVELDDFVIMPNHIHGIAIIRAGRDRPLHRKTLFSLVGAFKTTSSKIIHNHGLYDFCWQRSFYDSIVTNNRTLSKIREYIKLNPANWAKDENNHNCCIIK